MQKPFTTQIMGILNITPDSYSDGGLYLNSEDACKRIEELFAQNTDIIDIGAQATGPDSEMISQDEELGRIKNLFEHSNAIELLTAGQFSLDTYNARVAEYALKQGASIINDISGLRYDPIMVQVVADYDAHIVIMHSKESGSHPHATREDNLSPDIFVDIVDFFESRISYALDKGIEANKIILDPGMGMFLSNNPHDSLEITSRARELKMRFKEFKVLYGVSRKSFITNIFGKQNQERCSKLIEIDLIEQGVNIIRTHNPALLIEMFIEENQQ